jgi:pSer/pThr/pTyr-binding forkhead associated (FHA) protein
VYCTNCGHRNPDDARYCARCGRPLQDETTANLNAIEAEEEAPEDVSFPVHDLERGQALLVVKRGPNAGSNFVIDKDLTTAGRHPESDIFLDDVTVSRRHAEIHRRDGKFFVQDKGSLNGTYVNRQRVEETPLASGDELQIGKFKLVFFEGE